MPEILRASSAKAGHDPRGGLENLIFDSWQYAGRGVLPLFFAKYRSRALKRQCARTFGGGENGLSLCARSMSQNERR